MDQRNSLSGMSWRLCESSQLMLPSLPGAHPSVGSEERLQISEPRLDHFLVKVGFIPWFSSFPSLVSIRCIAYFASLPQSCLLAPEFHDMACLLRDPPSFFCRMTPLAPNVCRVDTADASWVNELANLPLCQEGPTSQTQVEEEAKYRSRWPCCA